MNAQTTGSYISLLRKKHGYTQAKLGEIIGVSDKAISKWENGEGLPDVSILPSLAAALNTTVDSLLEGEPISVKRLIQSLGSPKDIRTLKLSLVGAISLVAAIMSLKQLSTYVMIKVNAINLYYANMFGYDNGMSPDMSMFESQINPYNLISTTLFALISLGIMFFSYFSYRYAKKLINKEEPHIELRFFEVLLNSLWAIPPIYIAAYEIYNLFVNVSFIDGRVLIYVATLILIVVIRHLIKRKLSV